MQRFVLDVWSDVICPFCGIGRQQLLRAIEGFAHRDAVQIHLHAFELDQRSPATATRSADELVAKKYGLTVEQARHQHQRLEREAAGVGLTWHFDLAKPTNTFDAHRLILAAQDQGLGGAMTDRLTAAYFAEGAVVSDHTTLTTLGSEVGVHDVAALLASDRYAAQVREDEAVALELGISGVPTVLVDRKFMVVGARPAEDIVSVLDRAWQRRDQP